MYTGSYTGVLFLFFWMESEGITLLLFQGTGGMGCLFCHVAVYTCVWKLAHSSRDRQNVCSSWLNGFVDRCFTEPSRKLLTLSPATSCKRPSKFKICPFFLSFFGPPTPHFFLSGTMTLSQVSLCKKRERERERTTKQLPFFKIVFKLMFFSFFMINNTIQSDIYGCFATGLVCNRPH